MLRFLYRRYSAKFNDMLVEDYLATVPEQVRHDALAVIQTHKRKFQKFNDYMAYSLHRRMASDINNSERYQGMLIQLKMFDQLIQGRPDPEHEDQVKSVETVRVDYDDAVNKATNFAEKVKERNTQ